MTEAAPWPIHYTSQLSFHPTSQIRENKMRGSRRSGCNLRSHKNSQQKKINTYWYNTCSSSCSSTCSNVLSCKYNSIGWKKKPNFLKKEKYNNAPDITLEEKQIQDLEKQMELKNRQLELQLISMKEEMISWHQPYSQNPLASFETVQPVLWSKMIKWEMQGSSGNMNDTKRVNCI